MFSGLEGKKAAFVSDYLAFLGFKPEPATLDFLSQLMESHLNKVPFDGSNFTLKQPAKICLSNRQILDGFRAGRGGVCYQSNGAFRKLLHLLGFNATLVTVTMFRFGQGQPKPYADKNLDVHCAILVTIADQEYLVDLVWGNAFARPLPIGETQRQVIGEDERRCIRVGDSYQLFANLSGQWELEYQFKNEPKKTKDFISDVEFIAGKEQQGLTHHLSRSLLLMRRHSAGFDYVFKDFFASQNTSLFLCRKASNQTTTEKIEIHDIDSQKQTLKEFGVDEDNAEKIVAMNNRMGSR